MFERIKKFSAVIFLTLLIWAWAYLTIEKTVPMSATLSIAPSRPDLFVSFEDQQTPVSLHLEIKGPPSKITELRRRIREEGEQLEFLYNADIENHSTPGLYPLDLASFLSESDKLKGLGVSVVSSIPVRIAVKVEKLKEDWVSIQCLDENGVPVVTESIEPESIKMFVHEDWSGDSLKATVIMSAATIERARREVITAEPFVELEPGKRTHSKSSVEIRLPSTESRLKDYPINPLTRLGFIFSKNLQGKYTGELVNETQFRTLHIKASENAFNEYKNMPYQILVEIRDTDINETENIHHPIIYNFPPEYVKKGEIVATGPPEEAEIKITPVATKPD